MNTGDWNRLRAAAIRRAEREQAQLEAVKACSEQGHAELDRGWDPPRCKRCHQLALEAK